MTNVTLNPAPGIILIEPLVQDKQKIIVSNSPKGRLLTGKILKVGSPHITDDGIEIEVPCKAGQIAWFLSYEGNYDVARIDNKDIYFVLFRDLRGYR